MQKKTRNIIIGIILITLLAIAIFLILNKTKQMKEMPQNMNELAYSEYSTMIGDKEYGISTNLIQASSEIKPNISAGMIPVKWNGNCWELTTSESDNWYDYSKGLPAYIMLNDGTYQSKLVRDMTNKKLASENIVDGMGADIGPNDKLGSIYVWIPRYGYNEENEEIIYIKQGCSVAGTWKIPSIFTYEIENRKLSLDGIWVEYNSYANTNLVNTRVTELSRGEADTVYGFIGNTIATNANSEKDNVTDIVKKIGENIINDSSNTNRTILKIVDTNKQEPIDGKAYYDEDKNQMKIEITYNTNEIYKIIDIIKENDLNIESTNPVIACVDVEQEKDTEWKYLIIDKIGNQKLIKVTGTFFIHDRDTLVAFRDAVNKGETTEETKAYQVADVKLNENKYTKDETTGECIFAEDAEQWTPIGDYNSSSYNFKGKYYGNGNTISGLYINSSKSYQGLFGRVDGGEIYNLGIIDSAISGTGDVGGIVGHGYNKCTITNCYNAGTVSGTEEVGGIVGDGDDRCTITNCYNAGTVSGTKHVGGIVGQEYQDNTITTCYNTGTVSGTEGVGGITRQNLYWRYVFYL